MSRMPRLSAGGKRLATREDEFINQNDQNMCNGTVIEELGIIGGNSTENEIQSVIGSIVDGVVGAASGSVGVTGGLFGGSSGSFGVNGVLLGGDPSSSGITGDSLGGNGGDVNEQTGGDSSDEEDDECACKCGKLNCGIPRPTASLPDHIACDVADVIIEGYLPDKKRIAKNHQNQVVWEVGLVPDNMLNNWNKPIPKWFRGDVKKLMDYGNPKHLKPTPVNYECRWCARPYSAKNNQYRHERTCSFPGAPAHVCDKDCAKNCPGPKEWVPASDYRKGNVFGTLGRPRGGKK